MIMLDRILHHSRLLFGSGDSCRVWLDGKARGSAQALRIDFRGSNQTWAFLARQLFESAPDTRTPQSRDSPGAHLQIIERAPLAALLNPPLHHLRLATWISQQIDLHGPDGKPFTFSRHVRREADRHIRRNGFRLDFSPGAQALTEFFQHMYQPYVRARFDDQAILVDEHAFMRHAKGQQLARLLAGDEWVAGMLLGRDARTLRFGWFGACSSPALPGASEALDVMIIRWALEQKMERIILGHSRPSLRDGVLRYKSRIGGRIRATRFPQSQIFIRILKPDPWLVACLNEAGFIRIQAGAAHVCRVECNAGAIRVHLVPLEP